MVFGYNPQKPLNYEAVYKLGISCDSVGTLLAIGAVAPIAFPHNMAYIIAF